MADDNYTSNSILNDIGNNFAIGQTGLSQIATMKFININNSTTESTLSKVRFTEESSTKISLVKPTIVHSRLSQTSIFKAGSFQRRASDSSMTQVSLTKNRTAEIDIFNDGIGQSGITQVSPTQVNAKQTGFRQIDLTKIDPTQTDILQLNSSQVDTAEISFASSIPSEQFFNSHDSTPEITNVLNNTATDIWSDLLKTETQLDIDFQITDLPKGQLAEATITGFDNSGVPNAGTILSYKIFDDRPKFIFSFPLTL